jgi:hypothetical protein
MAENDGKPDQAAQDAANAENSKGADGKGGNGSEQMIPKGRFDEVNTARKQAEERLATLEKAEAEKEAKRLAESGEYKTLAQKEKERADTLAADLEKEKKVADNYRALRTAKVETLKKDFGDSWLDEFASFELPALEKLETQFKGQAERLGVNGARPSGSHTNQKPVREMSPAEFEQYKVDVAAGRIKPSAV